MDCGRRLGLGFGDGTTSSLSLLWWHTARGRGRECAMGRKAGVMRVNPKNLTRRTMPCFQEMLIFLSCLQKFNYDDDKVVNEKNALNKCMELQVLSLCPSSCLPFSFCCRSSSSSRPLFSYVAQIDRYHGSMQPFQCSGSCYLCLICKGDLSPMSSSFVSAYRSGYRLHAFWSLQL